MSDSITAAELSSNFINKWLKYVREELSKDTVRNQLDFINLLRFSPAITYSLQPADVLLMLPIYQTSGEFDFVLALFKHFPPHARDLAVLEYHNLSFEILSVLEPHISPAAYILLNNKNLNAQEEKALRALVEQKLNYKTYILSKINPDLLDAHQKELVALWKFLEQHDAYKHLLLELSKQYPAQGQVDNIQPEILSMPSGKITRDKKKAKDNSNTSTLITPNGAYTISHQVLGKGTYGRVKKVENLLSHTHKPSALKVFTYNPDKPFIPHCAENAIAILSGLGMLQDHCIVTQDNCTKHYIIMDYVPGDNLIEALFEKGNGTKKSLPFSQKIIYAKALVQKFKSLHGRGYIICDVKVNNFLLDNNNLIDPINPVDFDTWDHVNNQLPAIKVFSPGYAAPELEHEPQTQSSDRYAMGVILAEIFTPYNEQIGYIRKEFGGRFQHVEKYLDNEPINDLEKKVWQICNDLVYNSKKTRPSLDRVLTELDAIETRHLEPIHIANIPQINHITALLTTYTFLLKSKAIAPLGCVQENNLLATLKNQFLTIALAKAKEGKTASESITALDFQNALKQMRTQVDEKTLLDFLNHNRHVDYDKMITVFFDSKEPQTTRTYRSFVKATSDDKDGLTVAGELLNKAQYGSFAFVANMLM